MNPLRVAVLGVGSFGRNHARVISSLPDVELTAVVDRDTARGRAVADEYGSAFVPDLDGVLGRIEAAIVATPTATHEEIASQLLNAGIDVLVEKPIASSSAAGHRLTHLSESKGRILQVGHLERFNPIVMALEKAVTLPLFFEIHRMSVFSPRSLDVDVVLDLMIHDLDIVLSLARGDLQEIRAAGVSVLSRKVDIANVRLQFADGCVANLTASRVSVERIRKLRLFQPNQYLSLDYGRQDLAIFSVGEGRRIGFEQAQVPKIEPLKAQFDAFLDSIETRQIPKCSGAAAHLTLEVALTILDKIKEHSQVVSQTLVAGWTP